MLGANQLPKAKAPNDSVMRITIKGVEFTSEPYAKDRCKKMTEAVHALYALKVISEHHVDKAAGTIKTKAPE